MAFTRKTNPAKSNTAKPAAPVEGKRKEIGALWQRTSKKDETYFKVKITLDGKEHWFNAFLNRTKQETDERPNYIIFEEKPKNDA